MTRNLRDQYQRPRAIIYTPHPEDITALDRCLRYVAYQQYRMVGIVTEHGQAQAMIDDGRAQVMVVDRWRDLPPERTPRTEVVELAPAPDYFDRHASARVRYQARRTQRLNHRAGGA